MPQANTSRVWAGLVARVRVAEPLAMEELYCVLRKCVRFYLLRELGPQDVDDRVHDVFLVVVAAIQRGELRDPDRLLGFIRTIANRQVAGVIDTRVKSRQNEVAIGVEYSHISDIGPDPEQQAIEHQQAAVCMRILHSLSPRFAEVLRRFYLDEEPAVEIRAAMHLTETQFRLLKQKAKARYGLLGRERFALRRLLTPDSHALSA